VTTSKQPVCNDDSVRIGLVGTLGARELGRRGVPVVLASGRRRASGQVLALRHARRPLPTDLRSRRLLGRLTLEEAVDPTWTSDDPAPARAGLLLEARRALRHPRSWLRAVAFAPSAVSRQPVSPASEQPEPPLRRSAR
jgi:hypothetical protein